MFTLGNLALHIVSKVTAVDRTEPCLHQRPAQICRTVFDHRRVRRVELAGLICGWVKSCERLKLVWFFEASYIAYLRKYDGGGTKANTRNSQQWRIYFSNHSRDLFVDKRDLSIKETYLLNDLRGLRKKEPCLFWQ